MHAHTHETEHSSEQFNVIFAVSVFVNLIYTVFQGTYAVIANSMSLLADAGHNLGDVLGLCLAWGANYLLSKPRSVRYSYGYKRTTIIASISNALILVGTAAIIGFESVAKFFNPQLVAEWTMIVVAAIGVFVNAGTASLFMKGMKDDLNIKGAFLHLAYDALISIGVVIAGGIMLLTGWLWVDPLLGLIIVIIILAGSWELLRNSMLLLLDAVPHHINQSDVSLYLSSLDGVKAIHDLHIWGLSTKEVALTAHLVMPNQKLSDEDFHHINHELKDKFNIAHVTLQVEEGNERHPCSQEITC